MTEWREQAACRDADADEMFVRGAEQRRSKQLCMTCPVRTPCLAEALDNRISFGVWGGMTERERRALIRRRPDVRSWAELLSNASRATTVLERHDNIEAEFDSCFKAEYTRLVGFLIAHGVRAAAVEDAAQAAFEQAYRQWPNIREPRAWLRTVATRIAFRTRDLDVSDLDHGADLPSDIEIADETRAVYDTLQRLPFRQRQVMAWQLDGFSSVETARELGLTPENVRKTKQRAIEALKRILSEGEEAS